MRLTRRRYRNYWLVFGLIMSLLFIYMTLPFLDGIVYGVFLYYAARPIYNKINSRLRHDNLSAFISIAIIVFFVVIPISFIGFSIINTAINQINLSWIADDLPSIIEDIISAIPRDLIDITYNRLYDMMNRPEEFINLISYLSKQLTSIGEALTRLIITLFVMLVVGFFLLRDDHMIREYLVETLGDKKLINKFIDDIDSSLHSIFFGSILVVFITSILASLSFIALNMIMPPNLQIPFPIGLGVLCGIATLLPVIGIKGVWIPIFIYLLSLSYSSGNIFYYVPYLILFLIVVNLVVDILPDMIIRPLVSREKMHLGLIILAFIFGPMVFGAKGIFLGPIIVIITLNFFKTIFPEIIKSK
ncbi:MAG: hypothetical protein DRO94_00235 [Candidatus Altiarchaeales archaeon]|nr:MAG: hypothetical protein DRO95_00440 [Candidatus Altiarchaeales archaeon]RLI95544.1 MAG: hypothetical protein DRO94_00235 [Candidatus Altiarchaeales archaeon]HDO82552.1 AI-2E family transporter [Candidatus Altiarchaeales archaeon]HEX55201.1 AI-2E family transporter [Candidatus Altiarchaeales archaeon]